MKKSTVILILGYCLKAFFFLAIPVSLSAQVTQDYYQQLVEIISENLEGDGEFDYSELGELLDRWQRNPININSDEVTVLTQWNIISDFAYQKLQDHIRRNGPLLSILELQSIQGFDASTIRLLQVIANVPGRDVFTQTASLGNLFLHGQNEIYLRGGRTIETAAGYLGDPPKYEGSPDKVYLRLRHRNGNVLSYGITGEKDAGEAFFRGSNKSGFDFYSAHLSLQHFRTWLPALMIGDFTASFGQGLIMHSGYGVGKSSFVTSIKRTGNQLRPYTSVDENNFLRGIGVTLKPTERIEVTLFGSKNKRDGNLVIDTIRGGADVFEIQSEITSLQTSNLHRTASEIADENAIDLGQFGMSVTYQYKRTHLGLNGLHSALSSPLNRTTDLYNQYYFNGKNLTNASVDYGIWLAGMHLFGETAVSDNGGLATVNGLLAGLDRHVMAAILFRSFARNYQALTPNAFAESSTASNETGLYTGIEITPSVRWKIQFYHDMWVNPWLRYRVDNPSKGDEYFSRITYTVKRRLELYLQYRTKTTGLNYTKENASIPDVLDQRKSQARLNINNMLDKAIQLRTRLEWSFYNFIHDDEKGFLVYQDLIYKPISSPWSFSARVTLFDTDGYNSRIYTYENDLIYYYAIPAFSDKGSRFYVNVRYKGIRHLTAELKFARTQWLDMNTVGSGNDLIQGNRRSEIRGQLIYRFDN